MNPQWLLRVAGTLVTATWSMARAQPLNLLAKVGERLRQTGSSSLQAAAKLLPDYGDALRTGPTASRTSAEFALPIISSAPIPEGEEVRPLFLFTNSLPFTQSGYTLRSHSTLTALAAQGVPVDAVTRLGYPVVVGRMPGLPSQQVDGIEYGRMLPVLMPASFPRQVELAAETLASVAAETGATVIHTTSDYRNALVASRAAARAGLPWVYEVRGEPERTWLSRFAGADRDAAETSRYYREARRLEASAAASAAAVVVLSEVSKHEFIARGVSGEAIHVIPNAIADEDLEWARSKATDSADARRSLGLPAEGYWIGAITSVVEYEGLDSAIAALALTPEDIRLLIVGDGAALPDLQRQAQEAGLSERVHFVGRQPSADIMTWYSALDLFLLPRIDSHVTRTVTPLKALQAMACDAPVLASDLPALREVTGGLARYVVPGDAEALAAEILRAREQGELDDATRTQYSQFLENRTWSVNARRLQDIYRGARASDDE